MAISVLNHIPITCNQTPTQAQDRTNLKGMVYPQSSWMNIRHTHIQSDVAKCVLQTVCGSGRTSKLPMHTRLQRNNCTISFASQLTNSRIQSRKDAVIYCICVDLIFRTKKSVNENDEIHSSSDAFKTISLTFPLSPAHDCPSYLVEYND